MTEVLIIGGGGFVGRALHRLCVASGIEVVSADFSPDQALNDNMWPVDVTNAQSLHALLTKTRPETVVTLAAHGAGAQGLVAGANARPGKAVDVNIKGIALLLEACAAASCPTVVLASSTTVYGPAAIYDNDRVHENVPLSPATVYGATKAAAEHLAFALSAQFDIRTAAVRLPLVYGPGRWYGGALEAFFDFAGSLAAGRDATIHAWTQKADWVHVDDAARVLLAAARTSSASGPYNAVGHTDSLAGLAQALAAHATAPAHIRKTDQGGPGLPLVSDQRMRSQLPVRIEHKSADSGTRKYLSQLRRLT